MTKKLKVHVESNALIKTAYLDAPFDQAKSRLEDLDFNIISLEESANLRSLSVRGSNILYGNVVREGFLVIPRDGIFLTKDSPIMHNPEKAVEENRRKRDYSPTKEEIERAKSNSIRIDLGRAPQIPTNRFSQDPITTYLFGKYAEEYGLFLRERNVLEMPIWAPSDWDHVFARQMEFILAERGNGGIMGIEDLNYSRVVGIKKVRLDKREVISLVPRLLY